ncbi:E3 ubiquitin-protein ligase RNF144A-like isoform X1 [Iris pallida]|uniref:RBR-type E3 ubiquitin transferase n=1 Tax=Iris pallida TaxID=29817 RepID=A0AAX6HME1_IRIPA|nr:E3 ubiquitin-protein ligase RNF144A-like isoform X1 [Iris pallida]
MKKEAIGKQQSPRRDKNKRRAEETIGSQQQEEERKRLKQRNGASSGQSRPPPARKPDAHCGICMDPKFLHECFPVKGCSHRYCVSCVRRYVEAKVGENATSIRCPEQSCRGGVLDPEHCRPILGPEVHDRWGRALCDALFVGAARFYCPFKDCSGLLINEGEGSGGEEVRESECPYCHRLFCARCRVPWHSGVRCEDRTKLAAERQEESMLREMAQRSKWGRCPNCKFYVSRTGGCDEIVCRCKYRFCYICGAEWSPSHYNCKRVRK